MRDVATLLEALPYIREFHGKTAVIKYGGAAMEDPALREEFARDVVLLKYVGLNPIVVHGGGPDITAYMERLGLPVQFVGGLRVSDEATVEVAKMVLVGKVNKEIVGRLHRHGQPAVGLCGDDGALFRVARRTAPGGEDIGFVGRIERVNVDVLQHIARDYIPVIASVGADREGHSYNINADEAAGAVARELGAYKIVFLTDVAGWLADPEDPASLIGQATAEQVRDALPGLEGGMRPKLQACLEAIQGGVSSAHIVDGRIPHSLLLEFFTDAGIGTKIEAAPMTLADAAGDRGGEPDVQLRALSGRVRARRGGAAVGRRGRGVPRLPLRHLGHQRRALPPARGGGRARAGRQADARLNLSTPSPRCAWRSGSRRASLGGKVFLCNSGAEANEAAIKLARKARPGGDIVVGAQRLSRAHLRRALRHPPGVKAGALRAAGARLSRGRPRARGAPRGGRRAHRRRAARADPGRDRRQRALRGAAARRARGLRRARRRADLRRDPVRHGPHRHRCGPTSRSGCMPDAFTAAKALGGGLPIGALVTGERLADVFAPGDHGSTFAGGPVICAAALAALDIVEDPVLLAHVRELGLRLAAGLEGLPHVLAVRGRGLMLACELDISAPEVVRRALLEQRLVVNATGPTTVRLLPPLIITEAEVDAMPRSGSARALAG